MRVLRIVAMILLIVNSAGALFGGYKLMSEPSGASLQMKLELLEKSPFDNYFIPGLILFSAVGIISLTGLLLFLFKSKWAYLILLIQGCILGGWIIIEAAMIRQLHFFQFIFIGIAISFLFIGNRIRNHIINDSV